MADRAARAVVARNFPQAWVAATAVGALPSKVLSLLQRIGATEGEAVISQGPTGLQALAFFATAKEAQDAVRTLHGTDLRTAQEKRAAGFEGPKESERFWLRIAGEAGVPLPQPVARTGPGSPRAVAPAPAASPAVVAEVTAPRRARPIPTGIVLSPFPASWAEGDVQTLTGPYGKVMKVRMLTLSSGLKGAYINYALEAEAKNALSGLHGISLMGKPLRCVQQEEYEAPKPTQRFVVFVDELVPPSARPVVEPRLDDREVFIDELPKSVRTEEAAKAWLGSFGEATEVSFVQDVQLRATGKAYAKFRTHTEALAAVLSCEDAHKVSWSESERVLAGSRGPYGLDMIRRIVGDGSSRLQDVVRASGVGSLAIAGLNGSAAGGGAESGRVHFVMRCEHPGQVEKVRGLLAAELRKAHDAYKLEVRGSLLLAGFPATTNGEVQSLWSEKGLKFVFAPFGGLASVVLEEDTSAAGENSRVAYVKLRNEASAEKAVANLHQTKVGDGELVEECVVTCQRWPVRSWADSGIRAGFFIDQLGIHRRPLEMEPSAEDRELFVRNLPFDSMNPQTIQEYFEGFGQVEDLNLIKNTFTEEYTGEGYVRFKQHSDAELCLKSMTPSGDDAEESEIVGAWSESERALQRKRNCYSFNMITELVGMDGSGLTKLKQEGKLDSIWLLAESLQQKDRAAPPLSGRQLQFVGKASEEAHAKLFREALERTLEEVHTKIADRLVKRKRKAAEAAGEQAAAATQRQAAAAAAAAAVAAAAAPVANGHPRPPAGAAAAWMGPPGWPQPAAPPWGVGWQAAPGATGGPPPGFAGAAPPPAGWAAPPPAPQASVFEMGAPAGGGQEHGGRGRRHHGDGGDKERRRRSNSRKRRRRREGGDDGQE